MSTLKASSWRFFAAFSACVFSLLNWAAAAHALARMFPTFADSASRPAICWSSIEHQSLFDFAHESTLAFAPLRPLKSEQAVSGSVVLLRQGLNLLDPADARLEELASLHAIGRGLLREHGRWRERQRREKGRGDERQAARRKPGCLHQCPPQLGAVNNGGGAGAQPRSTENPVEIERAKWDVAGKKGTIEGGIDLGRPDPPLSGQGLTRSRRAEGAQVPASGNTCFRLNLSP